MIRRPPRSTLSSSSAASDVYKRQMLPVLGQVVNDLHGIHSGCCHVCDFLCHGVTEAHTSMGRQTRLKVTLVLQTQLPNRKGMKALHHYLQYALNQLMFLPLQWDTSIFRHAITFEYEGELIGSQNLCKLAALKGWKLCTQRLQRINVVSSERRRKNNCSIWTVCRHTTLEPNKNWTLDTGSMLAPPRVSSCSLLVLLAAVSAFITNADVEAGTPCLS